MSNPCLRRRTWWPAHLLWVGATLLSGAVTPAAAQFIDPPGVGLERLPPITLEMAADRLPPMTVDGVSAIPAWVSLASGVAPAAYQDTRQPVVEPVQPAQIDPRPTVTLPGVTAPERYFNGDGSPPRSGSIWATTTAAVPLPPDPEELDNCNLPEQHQLAMVDLMGRNELLISAGTVSPVGDHRLDNYLLTGWGIQGAVRHLWCCGGQTWMPFSEGGGGFWENGAMRSSITTSGTLIDSTTGNSANIFLDDFYETTLRDLRRATVHAALGTYFMPARWQQPGIRNVQFVGRMGLHWGHARATYRYQQSGDLQAAIADRIALGSLPSALSYQSNVAKSDTYFGMFTSLGVAYNRYNVWYGCFRFSEVSVGIDVQYTYDWLDLSGWNGGSSGLATLAPMATFRLMF
ncbi:MAG: hypothetical protein JNG90_13300 [Planctomycetaceae bacterium]|nr:hypothetical protein [Planctomycetaceae bacterium]